VPGQPAFRSLPANDLIREKWVKVVHRIDLGRGRVPPGCAEGAEAAFHFTEHEASLLPKAIRAYIATPHGALLVAALPLGGFAAAGPLSPTEVRELGYQKKL